MILYYSIDGLNWSVLTSSMLAGSFEGRFELLYPHAEDYNLNGMPVGAFGYPWAELKSTMLPAAGMASWLGLFSQPTITAVPIFIDVWSAYHNMVKNVQGYLEYPRWERNVGYAGAGQFYTGVDIKVNYITSIAQPHALCI
jgi:hypothetical protein